MEEFRKKILEIFREEFLKKCQVKIRKMSSRFPEEILMRIVSNIYEEFRSSLGAFHEKKTDARKKKLWKNCGRTHCKKHPRANARKIQERILNSIPRENLG